MIFHTCLIFVLLFLIQYNLRKNKDLKWIHNIVMVAFALFQSRTELYPILPIYSSEQPNQTHRCKLSGASTDGPAWHPLWPPTKLCASWFSDICYSSGLQAMWNINRIWSKEEGKAHWWLPILSFNCFNSTSVTNKQPTFSKHFADLSCGQLYGDSPLELCGCHTPSLGWLCLCWWKSEVFRKLNNDGTQFLKLYKELLYDIFLEVYTVDIHDHAKILWPQLQEGTNHWGRVIVGFWITQDRGIWHCGLQFNHKKNSSAIMWQQPASGDLSCGAPCILCEDKASLTG